MQRLSDLPRPYDLRVLVTPRFNLAATVWFLDPFRAANYLAGRSLFRWTLVSADGGHVDASNAMAVTTVKLADAADDQPDLAVVSSSWTPERYGGGRLRSTLRRWARLGVPLGALDTGAFVLAEAGLLEGRRATVHYEHMDAFGELYPTVELCEDLYVLDNDRLTCCGGAASADMALQILRATQGETRANAAARYLFHERLRAPGESQYPIRAEPLGPTAPEKLRSAIAMMEDHLENAVPIAEIAVAIGLSQRQLERLFADHVGLTPMRYYTGIRLDRARGLVTQTDMPLYAVAVACGFQSAEHFSRAYRSRFGLPPRRDRIEGRVPFEFRAWPMHAPTRP
ncbi:MAG: GlxA family transcriptional regulator [Pseudomonadota bacterium]